MYVCMYWLDRHTKFIQIELWTEIKVILDCLEIVIFQMTVWVNSLKIDISK